MNFRYYLGPWASRTDPAFGSVFHAPGDARAVLDFRSISDAAQSNFGLFAVPSQSDPLPQSDYTYLGFGYISYVTLSSQQKAVWQSALKLPSLPAGNTLGDVVWDTLVNLADPEGLVCVPPLMPTVGNYLEIHLQGHSVIKSAAFTLAPGKPQLEVLKKQYAAIRKDSQDGKHKGKNGVVDPLFHRKVLDYWKDKYRLKGNAYRMIQGSLPDEPPAKHETTISDDFNRSDSSSLGSDWASLASFGSGTEIKSNQVLSKVSSVTTDGDYWRHATSLSSDDMQSQIAVGSSGVSITNSDVWSLWLLSGLGRLSDANNMYRASLCAQYVTSTSYSEMYLQKFVGGVTTDLATYGKEGIATGDTVKCVCDGSSISCVRAGGVSRTLTVTDTSHSGSLRSGFLIFSGAYGGSGVVEGYGDNWTASDLYAPPDTPGSFAAAAGSPTHSAIALSWADVADETSYDLDWSPDGVGSWTALGPLSAGVVSYSHTGLSPSTAYYYRLRATNSNGSSAYTTANRTTAAAPATGGGLTVVFVG